MLATAALCCGFNERTKLWKLKDTLQAAQELVKALPPPDETPETFWRRLERKAHETAVRLLGKMNWVVSGLVSRPGGGAMWRRLQSRKKKKSAKRAKKVEALTVTITKRAAKSVVSRAKRASKNDLYDRLNTNNDDHYNCV